MKKEMRLSIFKSKLEKLSHDNKFMAFLGRDVMSLFAGDPIIIKKRGEFLAILPGNTKEKGVFFVDSFYGQDSFSYDKKSTSTYWIINGEGEFTINSTKRKVKAGDIVTIPNNTTFYYSGNMQLVEKMEPNFEDGNVVQVGDLIDYSKLAEEDESEQ